MGADARGMGAGTRFASLTRHRACPRYGDRFVLLRRRDPPRRFLTRTTTPGRGPLVSRLPYRWRAAAFVAVHLALLAGSYFCSFLLRFDGRVPDFYFRSFVWSLPIVLGARLVALVTFRLHRGLWRFSSVADLVALVRATTLSSAFVVAFIALTRGLNHFPRSVLVIDYGLTLLLLG